MAILAAQHGMIWILNPKPIPVQGEAGKSGNSESINRIGSLFVMTQSDNVAPDQSRMRAILKLQ